jgi:translocation and assembly module TamB
VVQPTAAKSSIARRALLGFALVLALALLVAGAGIAWLARSEGGSAWLLARVPGLSVTGPSGRLLGGAFAAERLELRFGERVLRVQGLAWQDARWSWRPFDGAWAGVVLVAPRAERIELLGKGSTAAAVPPTSLRLPLALTLQDARIGRLQIDPLAPFTNIAGSATLGAREGAEHQLGSLAFDWDRARVQGRGTLASDPPFALDLQAQARSQSGSPTPWQASATARGALEKLALQAQLGSDKAPGAALRAEASVLPFAAWPLAALSATAQDLDLAPLGSGLPTTRLSGRADIDSRGLDAPVTARVALANAAAGRWDQQRLPIAALELDLAGHARERSRLTVQRFTLQLPPGAGRIDGSGEWRAATAQLALRLQGLRPALLDVRAPAMLLAGNTTLDLQGLPSPDGQSAAAPTQALQARLALDGRLDARSALPVQASGEAQAERSAGGWRIELREMRLRSGIANVQGGLTAQQRTGAALQVQSRGELAGFDPALWFPGTSDSAWRKGPHRLAGRWRADLNAPAGAAAKTLDARLLAWRGEAELSLQDSQLAGVPLQATVKLDGRAPGWAVDADLRAAANHATLQGRLAPRADEDRWRIELDAPALAALQPLLDLHSGIGAALRGPDKAPIAGQLSGQLQSQGRWPALGLDGQVRATALQAAGLRAARLQLKGRAGPDAKAALDLQADAEGLLFGGLRADTLQARVDGSLAEHRIALDLQSPLRPPAWADPLLGGKASGSRIIAKAQGQWLPSDARQGPLPGRWQGQAIDLEARERSAPAASAAWLRARDLRLQLQLDAKARPLSASAEPGRVEGLGAAARWSQASWRAGNGGAPAEAALEAQLEPLAVAAWIKKLRPSAGISGDLMLAGQAKLQIGARVAADVVLERASGDLTLTDDSGSQPFGLSDLRLAIAAQDGTWHFTQALAGRNVGVLAGAQSLRLSPQARWPAPATPMQGVLEWQIADLGAWAPFTPPGWRLSGTLRTGAALGGTFGAPEITGDLSGSKLAVRNLLQGVDVRDGELALTLRGNQANIDRFVFKGGAGELRVTGGATLGAEPAARLKFDAERFQWLGRFDRRIVTSGSASLALTPQALALDGRFRIDEGLIDFSRTEAPSLDSDVQVRGGRRAVAQAEAAEADATANSRAGNGGIVRNARVALQVDLGNDLKLRGRGLDTQLRGELNLSTPGGRLAVNGSVRTEAGSYAAYGQKLSIERGVLRFDGAAENPRLDILAIRPNLDLRVGVLVSGSAQLPRVRLFSEPEMSDTDKLSWLVLGRAPEGLGRTDTALLQRAALALLAGEGEGLDRALLANIGLDEFSVRQTETGEVKDTVVTLGKQLSRRWYVGYERGVNSTTGTWQLIYRVAQRFTVRAQAGEDNALDAIWTWRWN